MNNSDKKYKTSDPIISKVDEPKATYNLGGKISTNIEDHPLFVKVIEKSKKDSKEGKGISHEEMMQKVKEKYTFLK